MSVQHLESLNDVVGEITGIRRARDRARHVLRHAPTRRSWWTCRPTSCWCACARARCTIGDVERAPAGQFFQQGQPARAARDRAAAHRRRGRGRGAAATAPRSRSRRPWKTHGPPAVLHRARRRAPSTWCAAPRASPGHLDADVDGGLRRDAAACSACRRAERGRILKVVKPRRGARRQDRDPHRQRRAPRRSSNTRATSNISTVVVGRGSRRGGCRFRRT